MVAISRRGFLKGLCSLSVGGAGTVFVGSDAPARADNGAEKSLSFLSMHTNEKFTVTYWSRGEYLPQALREVQHAMRDWRTSEVFPIDTALLDFLFDVRVKLNTTAPYRIISGFRSLSTNATLAKRNDKVASRSLHMAGMAIDTSLPGIDTRRLRDAALSLRRGGVGYYQKSNFVHLDTGRVRQW